jgi:DNA-binding NtrC family response regulator
VPVDVRLVAATHQPLDRMAAEGSFRDALLWRLQVVTVSLPPLRERRGDIPALAARLLVDLAGRHSRRIEGMSEAARRALLAYDWPGNVRELRNALERAVVLAEDALIDIGDLPGRVTGAEGPVGPVEAALADLPFQDDRAARAFERSYLAAALERHGGNVSATARSLGIHRQSLQKMLKRLGVQP